MNNMYSSLSPKSKGKGYVEQPAGNTRLSVTVTEIKVYAEGSREEVVNSHGLGGGGGVGREGTFEQLAFELCLER